MKKRSLCRAVAAVHSIPVLLGTFGGMIASHGVLAESGGGRLEEIVVTSRRREENLDEVPVAVSAIGPETLQNYAISDITAVSQMVPSMVVGRQVTGSSASVFLRGVGSTSLSSGFDQSVSLNLDGIAMSRGREIVSAMYDIAQVEVLKGPQALFFGKNSTAGVINMTSRMPTEMFEAGIKAGYEFEADEKYAEAFVSGPLAESVLGRFAMRTSSMEGFFDNPAQANVTRGLYREPNSDRRPESDDLSGRLTLQYVPADSPLVVTWRGSYTKYEDSGAADNYERLCGSGRTTPLPTSGIAEPYADCKINGRNSTANMPTEVAATMPYARNGQTYTDHEAYSTGLTIDYDFDDMTLTSITGGYGFRQTDSNSFSGATAGIFVTQLADFDQLSEEVRLTTDFDGAVNAMVGAFFAETNFIFNTAGFAAAGLPPDPATGRYYSFGRDDGFDGSTRSVFAEITWQITDELEFSGGARWSQEHKDTYVDSVYRHPLLTAAFSDLHFDDRFSDTNLSPQATLTWKLTPDSMVYIAYKEGFKSGGYNTSINLTAGTTKGDGEFGSETAKGYEVGMKSVFLDDTLRLIATAYNYDYDDLQVQVFDATTSSQRVGNAGTLNTRGAEVEANWIVPRVDGLELRTAINYNEATYENYIGSCYTGQTIGEGCNDTLRGGVYRNQNYDGRTPPKAPLWSGRLGLTYRQPIGNGLQVTFTADASYSDEYNFSDSLRPDAVQDSFTRYDASVRLSDEDEKWELALIGRNLTDELVVTSANDMPAQGAGGTGTAVGLRSDMNAIVDRPRQVTLQGTYRF